MSDFLKPPRFCQDCGKKRPVYHRRSVLEGKTVTRVICHVCGAEVEKIVDEWGKQYRTIRL